MMMCKVRPSSGQGRKVSISLGQKITFAATLSLLAGLSTTSGFPQAGATADEGKQLFERRCSGCHSMDKDKEGPRLKGVYGRLAGTIPSFKYSAALQGSHITWDTATLDKWLANPDSVVADNDMDFHVSSAVERDAIIRFLKQSSGQ
jgi:cytochrome c